MENILILFLYLTLLFASCQLKNEEKIKDGEAEEEITYKELIATVGSTVTFECETTHVEYNILTWWRNDSTKVVAQKQASYQHKITLISSNSSSKETGAAYSGRIQFEGKKLILSSCEVSDSSLYYCETSINGQSLKGTDILLTIQELRGCTDAIEKVTIISGSNIFFPCTPKGNPAPTVTWSKMTPRKTIEQLGPRFSATRFGLNIEKAALSDSGTYLVTLTNSLRTVVITSELNVISADSVKPSNYKAVDEDKSIEIECGKRPVNPGDHIQWKLFHGVNVLARNPHKRFAVDSRGYLIINPVKRNDTGLYVCASRRRTSDGDVTLSVNMYINVRYAPKIMFIRKTVQVFENRDVALPCSALGNPGVTFRWFFPNGEVIKNNDQYKISTNGSLVIRNVHVTIIRNYTCAPYNEIGDGQYGYTQVEVLVPPKFLNPNAKLLHTQLEQSNITLDCSCSGVPKPNITWSHVGNTIDKTRAVYNPVGLLELRWLKGSDAGTYTCFVESYSGTLFRSITLTVIAKPGRPKNLQVSTIDGFAHLKWTPSFNGGSTQYFEIWYRDTYRATDYTWNTSPRPVTTSMTQFQLQGPKMDHARRDVAYFFSIRAKNKEGYSLFSDVVKVLRSAKNGQDYRGQTLPRGLISTTPLPPYKLLVNVTKEGYTLSWKQTISPGYPPYSSIVVEYRDANSSNFWKQYTIKKRSRRSLDFSKPAQANIKVSDIQTHKIQEFQLISVASDNKRSAPVKPVKIIFTSMPEGEGKIETTAASTNDHNGDIIPPIVLGVIFGLFVIILIVSLYCFFRRRKQRYHASRNEKKMLATYGKQNGIHIDDASFDGTDGTKLLSGFDPGSPRRFHLRTCPALQLGKFSNEHNGVLVNGTKRDDVHVLLEPNRDEKHLCTCNNRKYMTLSSKEQKTEKEKKELRKILYKSTSSPSVLLTSDMDGASSIDPSELLDEEEFDVSDIEKDDVADLTTEDRFSTLNRLRFKDSYDQFCRSGEFKDGSRRRLSSNDKTEDDKNMNNAEVVALKDENDASYENSATESEHPPSPDALESKTNGDKSSGFGDGSNSTSDSESTNQEIAEKGPLLLRPAPYGYTSEVRRDLGYASDFSTRSSPLDYTNGRNKYQPPSQRLKFGGYNKPPFNYYSEDEGMRSTSSNRPVAPPSYNQAVVDIERMSEVSEKNEITDSEEMYDNLLAMERELGVQLGDSLDELSDKGLYNLPPRAYSNPRNFGRENGYFSDVQTTNDRYSDREKTERCAKLLNEFKSNRNTEQTFLDEEPVQPPVSRCHSVMDSVVTEEPRLPPVLRRSNSTGTSSVFKEWLV